MRKPLNSTTFGRVLIAIACTWGAVALIGFLFMGTPLKTLPGWIQVPVVGILLFAFWLVGTTYSRPPSDPNDKS